MTAEHDGPSVVFRQLGGPREVVHGFSEEARIRGFPSPSLGGFGFVVICCGPNLPPAHPHGKLTLPLLFAAVCRIPADCDFHFGSTAAPQHDISPTDAFEREPVVQQRKFDSEIMNVCFSRKRSFVSLKIPGNEGPLTAEAVSKRKIDRLRSFLS